MEVVEGQYLVTGDLYDVRESWPMLREAMQRQPLDVARDDEPTSDALEAATGRGGAVICAFNQDGVLVGWLQLVRTEYLFRKRGLATVVQYWGDDAYLATNMFEALLAEANHFASCTWGSMALEVSVRHAALLPCLARLGARVGAVAFEQPYWYSIMRTDIPQAAAEQLLNKDKPLQSGTLQAEHVWQLVRY